MGFRVLQLIAIFSVEFHVLDIIARASVGFRVLQLIARVYVEVCRFKFRFNILLYMHCMYCLICDFIGFFTLYFRLYFCLVWVDILFVFNWHS